MAIDGNINSYEYKLKQAGLSEPLTTYLADPRDPDRLAAGFPAFSEDGKSLVGAGGVPVMGTSAPTPFTTRALAVTDNGQTCICASAQTATVNSSMPAGFGVAFKGAISFTAGADVTITDIRSTGAANPWCALVQTAANSYDVVGTKA